ncbi:(2Fe-2S)-binding protein [Methanolobus sp. ZRKC2]|uniref:(2Fe-2S)-binding protein n=1 Tax=Methanolobus sp. ZRKC2 TaxID=3125783 RepID=UPI00324A4ED0
MSESCSSTETKKNKSFAIPLVSVHCGESEQDESVEAIPCPVCGTKGAYVKIITVRHLVEKELIENASQSDYRICMDKKCNVAYYSEDLSIIFEKNDLKVPLWFKEDASPRYACYCSRITEEDVFRAVKEQKLTEINAIRQYYDPEGKCHCNVKNPTGKCCTNAFNEFIIKALGRLDKIEE